MARLRTPPQNVQVVLPSAPDAVLALVPVLAAACEPLEAEPLQPVMTPESINAAHRVAIIFFFTLESTSV